MFKIKQSLNGFLDSGIANAESHTHLQFALANATSKIVKEYVLSKLTFELNNKHRKTKRNLKSTTYKPYIIHC